MKQIVMLAGAALLGLSASAAMAEEGPMHHTKQATGQPPAPATADSQAPAAGNPNKPTTPNTPENNQGAPEVAGKGKETPAHPA